MATLRRALWFGFFSGIVLAACSEDGASTSASPTEADPCERLAQCCEKLSGATAAQCRSTIDTYRDRPEARDACMSAMTTFEQSGACGSSSGASDGGSAASGSHAICDQYIACIGSTTPEGLGAIVATYGPNGSCWSTGNEALCLDACRTGIKNVRKVFPDEKACPECLSDADCTSSPNGRACDVKAGRCVACTKDANCSGATPACNVTKNACVACTKDTHCASGSCDVVKNECVSCTSDAQCGGATPRCKKGPKPACVACLSGADCTTGACSGNTCCQPESCGELKAMWGINPNTWICGSTYSSKCSGAIVQCGGCTKGTCKSAAISRCSLEDTPCTPGVSGTCMNDEVCTYVPNKSGYICTQDIRGAECVYGAESYKCNSYKFSCEGANLVTNGKCRAYCKTNVDCPGSTCGFYAELGYGICT